MHFLSIIKVRKYEIWWIRMLLSRWIENLTVFPFKWLILLNVRLFSSKTSSEFPSVSFNTIKIVLNEKSSLPQGLINELVNEKGMSLVDIALHTNIPYSALLIINKNIVKTIMQQHYEQLFDYYCSRRKEREV